MSCRGNDRGRKGVRVEIGILGAGIMGCCLALELAQRGHRVDLIDLMPAPMNGASFHNEGKLHLGFVYANDPHKETHGLMIQGSLAFSPIIKKLCGYEAKAIGSSRPFYYFVPVDSQLSIDAIQEHFQEVEETIQQISQNSGNLYLDRRIDRYYERTTSREHNTIFCPDRTLGSFKTEECSVSTSAMADILKKATINHQNINFMGNTLVLAADRPTCNEVDIELRRNGKTWVNRYKCITNCLWDDRLRVDRTAGIVDNGPWIFRYKTTITISAPTLTKKKIPSATGILGAYGDVVNHNNGFYYVSWYPLSKIVQSTDEEGRILHEMVHQGLISRCIRKIVSNFPSIETVVSSIAHRQFVKDNIREMAAYIPSMAGLLKKPNKSTVGGGVILARGETDIDDPSSQLHQRSAIGPVAYGSYISIDTGKYCMAPLFALETADMITDIMQ